MKQADILALINSAPELSKEMADVVAGFLGPGAATALPALECQVMLGAYAVSGVLTTGYASMDGVQGFRLMTPAKRSDNVLIMADHYFDAETVTCVVIGRPMPRAPARSGNLILPG